ncbi:hypothetical protein EWI61_11680 [Methylolobus aquaticus]|nr:hypothetical protein EWI61_11680 [Methylolobus aquaticus]
MSDSSKAPTIPIPNTSISQLSLVDAAFWVLLADNTILMRLLETGSWSKLPAISNDGSKKVLKIAGTLNGLYALCNDHKIRFWHYSSNTWKYALALPEPLQIDVFPAEISAVDYWVSVTLSNGTSFIFKKYSEEDNGTWVRIQVPTQLPKPAVS